MTPEIVSFIGSAFMVLGAFIIATAAIGLIKLPDVYTRTSAVGTAAGLGVSFMIIGVVVLDYSTLNLIKGIIAIIAQLITRCNRKLHARKGKLHDWWQAR